MRVIEAVTDAPVCGHCHAPWSAPTEHANGCCEEDGESAPHLVDAQPDPQEGEPCPVLGCSGDMGFEEVEGCSCHLHPPCSACTDNPLVCLSCGWTYGEPTR